MASTRPNFRDQLRKSTAAARGAAARTIDGPDEETFARAEQVMASGGLVAGRRPTEGAMRPIQVLQQEEDVILNVPLEKVHDNDYNARAYYDPEVIRQRASEIALDGQKTPALAVPHPEIPGEYMLIEGHYRKRALQLLNRPTIKLTLRRDWTTPQQRYVQSWKANEERLANSPLDNAVQWAKVLQDKVVESGEKLAELLGVSAGQVSKALALTELPEPARQKARELPDIFTASTLYELSLYGKQAGEQALLALMERVASEGWSRRQVEEFRHQAAAPRTRKRREVSRQLYKIVNERGQYGTLKENDSGLVRLEVKITDPAERQKLMEELKRRFGLTDERAQLPLS